MAHAMPTDSADDLGRELVRYAVQRWLFCPYTGGVLDERRAVLVDGTDYGGRMDVMTDFMWDAVIGHFGTVENLANALGYKFDVYDGRQLFGR